MIVSLNGFHIPDLGFCCWGECYVFLRWPVQLHAIPESESPSGFEMFLFSVDLRQLWLSVIERMHN